MTTFFAYADLTWPEVDVLPRHTPLVIPLGDGYPLDRLESALGNPDQVGLLSPVPFGWADSQPGMVSLRVAEPLLGAMLAGLVDSLRDDGFRHVYMLTPQGIDLGLGIGHIVLPPSDKSRSVNKNLAYQDRSKVVLIPVGHTEQHGYHLPMSVDTLIIEAISQSVARQIPDQAVTLPVMPYGVSTHRSSFAGTLNVGGRAFEDFWLNLIDVLVAQGFDRFFFLSGHGGNCSFLTNVVKYAGERHRRIFCATTFLYLSSPEGVAVVEKHRRSTLGGMGHACELETSLILHLCPELVFMERVVDETDFIATTSYRMDWVETGALIANPPWDDDTKTGAYGAGSLATAEHGKIWLEAAIAEKISQVVEIHEQHERRQARRNSGYGLWGNEARSPSTNQRRDE